MKFHSLLYNLMLKSPYFSQDSQFHANKTQLTQTSSNFSKSLPQLKIRITHQLINLEHWSRAHLKATVIFFTFMYHPPGFHSYWRRSAIIFRLIAIASCITFNSFHFTQTLFHAISLCSFHPQLHENRLISYNYPR